MKRLLSIAAALFALAVLPAMPATALPLGTTNPAAKSDSDTIVIKGGRGHGRGHMKRGGRGHHYGWGRGRGHHYGWSRGRHRGW